MRLLVLGGTTEASRLADRLAGAAGIDPVLSLAGRTRHPALPPIPVRIGGFGGIQGLVRFLHEDRTTAVVDATHPFAAQMSDHAAAACARLGLPLATFTRPPWEPGPGDRWTEVPTLAAAVEALGVAPTRVFVATGRLGLAHFKAAPQHDYLVRTIDPPDPVDCPPRCRLLVGRGPFPIADEIALLRDERITLVVSKNSGGEASAGKITAARTLSLPVVMVARPPRQAKAVFTTVDGVLEWIAAHRGAP